MSTEQTNEITRTLLSYVEDFSAAYLAAAEKFAAQWAEILPQEAVGEDEHIPEVVTYTDGKHRTRHVLGLRDRGVLIEILEELSERYGDQMQERLRSLLDAPETAQETTKEPEPTESVYSWAEAATAFSPAFSDEEIDHRFLYHPPTDERVRGTHNQVRNIARYAAQALNEVVPAGREASLMMTALEEAEFWANAAVARNHDAVIAIWEAQHG